jgi:hypothetical protein
MPARPLIKRIYLQVLSTTVPLSLLCTAASETTKTTPEDYETPGPVNAEDFLPKSAFAGKKIFAEKSAENNGLENTYRVRVGQEEHPVVGTAAAEEFLRESRAINELRQISTAKAVGNGLKQSAKATYQTGKQMVQHPVESAKRIPEGASRFFGKVKGFFSQDQADDDQDSSAGEVVKGFLGVDDAKRKLAARLGVDVYSRNQTLQDELNRVASAMAGGGLAFDIGTLPIGGAAGVALTAIGIQQTVDSLINNSSEENLRKWNEQTLSKLGASQDLITEFLDHPWYTLRQDTIISTALNKVGIDPTIFLQAANKALTEEDGRYFEGVAELLAAYAQKAAPLQSFRLQDGLICAVDQNGVLVVPVSLDYAIWTTTVAQRVNELTDLKNSDQNIKSLAIWMDGKASERVKTELRQRGIDYQSLSPERG